MNSTTIRVSPRYSDIKGCFPPLVLVSKNKAPLQPISGQSQQYVITQGHDKHVLKELTNNPACCDERNGGTKHPIYLKGIFQELTQILIYFHPFPFSLPPFSSPFSSLFSPLLLSFLLLAFLFPSPFFSSSLPPRFPRPFPPFFLPPSLPPLFLLPSLLLFLYPSPSSSFFPPFYPHFPPPL